MWVVYAVVGVTGAGSFVHYEFFTRGISGMAIPATMISLFIFTIWQKRPTPSYSSLPWRLNYNSM
jgi:hypothetical protein